MGEGRKKLNKAILRHLCLLCIITDQWTNGLMPAASRHLHSSRPGLKEKHDGDVQDEESMLLNISTTSSLTARETIDFYSWVQSMPFTAHWVSKPLTLAKNHIVEILIIRCWLLNSLAKFDAMLYLYRLVHNVSSILLRPLGLHLALRMNREVTVNRWSTTDCGSSAGARAEQLSGPA